MKTHYGKALSLSLVLSLASQFSAAAVLKETPNKTGSDKQTSLIEKALDQQKRNPIVLPSTNDELKVLNTIRVTPTQNFLAAQHERFSRFVQAIFQPHAS
ncbi:DUF4179 domain-containing protein [Acinetobacter lactucae]|uniref:DUF4179 domain-containing protein n=1 Tax=Acinetobacter lactucae TaxID=1785128 RepID=A0A429K6P1_9GAMM|nr:MULTISPECIES: DUF4179 domain-containing protein [Acinetobacter calcoaceticus/baumannii complex]MCG9491984.1 DUF4179 domain-containing protein [Acinetobacter pittii]MCU4348491.1 DUF4179 domain-containing protein [Acinetobacter lactucae]RSO59587.1 DUF4179 domain-containing protein [Acinetobacter lactucae]